MAYAEPLQDIDLQRTYQVVSGACCRQKNVVYAIACDRCRRVVNVGETQRQIRERMIEHLREVRLMKDKPISDHFGQNHSANMLRFAVLESLYGASITERLTFSDSCDWKVHVKNISEKASTRLNLLRALKFRVSRTSLEKMYMAFVRPLLEYSDAVWDNCSLETKKQLDAIHVEAARIITGATKLCSIEKFFFDLGWESLQSRRNKHKLVIFYKILHGLTPDYLFDIVPPSVWETARYNLRNSEHIQNYKASTNLFLDSFFPSTIRAWNSLPNEVKEASSVAAFKHALNRNIKIPPKYFNAGTRMGQILHARLRMGCSSLNSDLYRKNIVQSPSCSCGEFESAKHFLFTCVNHSVARERYLPRNLHSYTINDLLHRKNNLSLHENEILTLQVQDFIIKSERFVKVPSI